MVIVQRVAKHQVGKTKCANIKAQVAIVSILIEETQKAVTQMYQCQKLECKGKTQMYYKKLAWKSK